MSSVLKLVLSFAFTTLGPMALAEVSFSSYIKRNHEVLKPTRSSREVVAFEKKEMFRDIASTPDEGKKADPINPEAITPAAATPTEESAAASSAPSGPER